MKIKSINQSIFLGLYAFLCACGGGGSDGSSPRNVSGEWQGAITKVSDTCGEGDVSSSVSHSVSQNQGAVVLVGTGGLQYIGNVVGEDGLSVDGSRNLERNCVDAIQIEYNGIDDDNDLTASIDVRTTRTCSGKQDCQLAYSGTVSRSGQAPVSLTPASPTVPISGGCAEINPNPAAGEYTGDGGCGISSTNFSVLSGTQNSVVLETFGANGATSFAILSTDSAIANSSRTDLTVLEVEGYSCTLACSAPTTFTATCFKEGGVTCVEKF